VGGMEAREILQGISDGRITQLKILTVSLWSTQ
jgi:hypothetical protein